MWLWDSILGHSAWGLGVCAPPQFWPENDQQNTQLCDIIQMWEGEQQHFTTKFKKQRFLCKKLGSENTVFIYQFYFDDCHPTVILRSFETIQGRSRYNSYCMSVCLAKCVDPVCELFLYRMIIHIYDQNMLPNNLTHDKSDVQTDPELYWMIHILNHQH